MKSVTYEECHGLNKFEFYEEIMEKKDKKDRISHSAASRLFCRFSFDG